MHELRSWSSIIFRISLYSEFWDKNIAPTWAEQSKFIILSLAYMSGLFSLSVKTNLIFHIFIMEVICNWLQEQTLILASKFPP